MAFTQPSDFTFKHTAQSDEPVFASTTELKTKLDSRAKELRDYMINTLLPELASVTAGSSGAKNIGVSSIGGIAGNDIQTILEAIVAAGSGTIPPDGTISDAKLATDNKIGSLAALNTTTKTSIVAAINEIVTSIASSAHTIPPGLIAQWHGLISAIPTGWVLCDGTNGTPDLRDKFVMGAHDQAAMNTTGGNNTTTLTTTQLPAHTHTGTTASDGNHTHTWGGTNFTHQPATAVVGPPYTLYSQSNSNTSSAGAHTHTFTTQSTGTGSAYDSRPAYYALAFIMKTA